MCCYASYNAQDKKEFSSPQMSVVLKVRNPGIVRRSWVLDQRGLVLTRGRVLGKQFNLSHPQFSAKWD